MLKWLIVSFTVFFISFRIVLNKGVHNLKKEHNMLDAVKVVETANNINNKINKINEVLNDNEEEQQEETSNNTQQQDFFISKLTDTEKRALINSGAYNDDCPVPLSKLNTVHIKYIDFKGNLKNGEIIVFHAISSKVLELFKKLYEIQFPLESVKPIYYFNGNDDLSMDANNTTAFHCRPITGGKKLSKHSYGIAIDINPIQNPYIKGSIILPSKGKSYINRSPFKKGMLENVVDIFKTYGFSMWAGNWKTQKDYMHFEYKHDK